MNYHHSFLSVADFRMMFSHEDSVCSLWAGEHRHLVWLPGTPHVVGYVHRCPPLHGQRLEEMPYIEKLGEKKHVLLVWKRKQKVTGEPQP